MSERRTRSPIVAFLAWLMMAAGVLLFTTAGACSMLFIISFIEPENRLYFGGLRSVTLMVLTLGGIPILVGVALFWGGLRLSRPPRSRSPRPAREHGDEPTTGA